MGSDVELCLTGLKIANVPLIGHDCPEKHICKVRKLHLSSGGRPVCVAVRCTALHCHTTGRAVRTADGADGERLHTVCAVVNNKKR